MGSSNNYLIYLIYFFQFSILLFFNYIFFEFIELSKNNKRYINLDLIDFCVDFSLLLGLLGTLISLGNAVSKANPGEFEMVIAENFSSALITTIVGGMIYGYCYLLRGKIFQIIHKKR